MLAETIGILEGDRNSLANTNRLQVERVSDPPASNVYLEE